LSEVVTTAEDEGRDAGVDLATPDPIVTDARRFHGFLGSEPTPRHKRWMAFDQAMGGDLGRLAARGVRLRADSRLDPNDPNWKDHPQALRDLHDAERRIDLAFELGRASVLAELPAEVLDEMVLQYYSTGWNKNRGLIAFLAGLNR